MFNANDEAEDCKLNRCGINDTNDCMPRLMQNYSAGAIQVNMRFNITALQHLSTIVDEVLSVSPLFQGALQQDL